jgi:hypothetical protein
MLSNLSTKFPTCMHHCCMHAGPTSYEFPPADSPPSLCAPNSPDCQAPLNVMEFRRGQTEPLRRVGSFGTPTSLSPSLNPQLITLLTLCCWFCFPSPPPQELRRSEILNECRNMMRRFRVFERGARGSQPELRGGTPAPQGSTSCWHPAWASVTKRVCVGAVGVASPVCVC